MTKQTYSEKYADQIGTERDPYRKAIAIVENQKAAAQWHTQYAAALNHFAETCTSEQRNAFIENCKGDPRYER